MEFVTNKNMVLLYTLIFIIGIVATYFAVNTINSGKINEMSDNINELETIVKTKNNEIESLRQDGENFTYHLLESMSLLDVSREIRANGNLFFDYAARIWFPQGKYQKVINNCSKAMNNYSSASEKFDLAEEYFFNTKSYTNVSSYQNILDLYIELSHSGYKLSMLRYNASVLISEIAEKLLNESYSENNTDLIGEFNVTLMQFDSMYQQALTQNQEIINEIEEEYGEFFNPNRKIP